MSLPIFVVDAFTAEPFRGNPAAVVLGHGEESWMPRVAAGDTVGTGDVLLVID